MAVCFFTCLCCFYKSIKEAINVIDASADFIIATKRIMLIPFVYFLLSIGVIVAWFFGYVLVMSINPIKASPYVP
jgi:hypothetical protein